MDQSTPNRADSYARRKAYTARLHRADFFVLRHLTQFIERSVDQLVTSGSHVGDLGCGEGPMRARIEARGGVYTGIDINQNAQGSVQLIADITDVPLPDSLFDVILCTEVLEHVSDTHRAFGELARLVRSGGHIILTAPFVYPLHEEPFDFVRLTPYQVRALARLNGLQVVSLLIMGNELEALATIWDNMWIRMGRPSHPLLRIIRLLSRILMNVLVLIAGVALRNQLPQKGFTNIGCVLSKE
jgi:SAM-dependent methyltransferase